MLAVETEGKKTENSNNPEKEIKSPTLLLMEEIENDLQYSGLFKTDEENSRVNQKIDQLISKIKGNEKVLAILEKLLSKKPEDRFLDENDRRTIRELTEEYLQRDKKRATDDEMDEIKKILKRQQEHLIKKIGEQKDPQSLFLDDSEIAGYNLIDEQREDLRVFVDSLNEGIQEIIEREKRSIEADNVKTTDKKPLAEKSGKMTLEEFSDRLKRKNIKTKQALIEFIESYDGIEVGSQGKFDASKNIANIEKVFVDEIKINEIGPLAVREAVEEIRRIELARIGTEFILGKIKNFEELKAETEKEGDKILINKARELWGALAVHRKNGANFTDLDGKCSLGIFSLAGIKFNPRDIKYVDAGQYVEGATNLDTGGKHGTILEKNGDSETLFVDHHGEETGSKTSAAQKAYDLMMAMGLLGKRKYLDNLVDFVNHVDNADYSSDYLGEYFKNSWNTFAGLEKFAQFYAVREFFKSDENPDWYRQLNSEELKKYGFIYEKNGKTVDRSLEQKNAVEKSLEALNSLEKEGMIIDSPRYGKIVVDIGGQIPNGFVAARAYQCDSYIRWSPDKKSFFISSSKLLEETYGQGVKVRERMIIKPTLDPGDLKVSLEEIITKMTDGRIDSEKLKLIADKEEEYIKNIGQEKETEFSPEELKIIEIYGQDAKEMLNFIENLNYEELGYEAQDIEQIKEMEKRRFWNKFKEDILNEGRISEEKIEEAIKSMQNI